MSKYSFEGNHPKHIGIDLQSHLSDEVSSVQIKGIIQVNGNEDQHQRNHQIGDIFLIYHVVHAAAPFLPFLFLPFTSSVSFSRFTNMLIAENARITIPMK